MMNKVILIMAMNIALLTSACSDNSTDVVTQSQAKAMVNQEATDTLAYLAKDCGTTNVSGTPVTFHATKLPVGSMFTSAEVCDYAGKLVDDYYRIGKESMKTFCDIADKFANEMGGGNYSVAKTKIAQFYEPAKAQPYLSLLKSCETKENRLKLLKDTAISVGIYSVGTIEMNGNSCKAYLASGETPPGITLMRYYRLIGSGACDSLDTEKLATEHFHPEERPNAITFGKFIKDRYNYNGENPKVWVYKDKEYSF